MAIGPLVNLASGYIQSLFSSHASGSSSTNKAATGGAGALGITQDTNQLSPFAQVLGSLQSLHQSNPSQYQQVTQQISDRLQSAAQSATAHGNSGLATELTALSTNFKNASTSGQLPNVQDLAQAVGRGHHLYGHGTSPSVQATSPSALSTISSTLSRAGIPIG